MKHIFRILKFTSELRWYYITISILTVLASVTTVLLPFLSGQAIDEISKGPGGSVRTVVILALLIFLMDVLANFINNVSGYLGDQMSAKMNRILSVRYFEHLLKLPQRFYDISLSGKLIGRLNRSVVQLSNFSQMVSNNFMQFIVSTLLALVIVAFYSWPVALMLASLYPLYIWLTVRTSDKWQKYQKEKNENFDIANGRFTEAISQMKVIKSFNQEVRELSFFRRFINRTVQINRPQSRYWHVRDVRRRLLLNFIFLAVYLYVFVDAVNGNMSAGSAVALILYAQQIRIPIFTISFLVDSTQRAVADSRDFFELMDEKPEIDDDTNLTKLDVKHGVIEFDGLGFAYDKEPVLSNISFKVAKDSKLALVGESGEGKTTLTNLLMRLYEPVSGEIRIDGQNIAKATKASVRQSIAVVFQDPALFSGTIKENIAYANPESSQQDIERAARAANAHEFIEDLTDGYDTEIGERGLKLSGGQKQRIAIARALLKDAPILVLDEATSSLDSRSEALVQEALERLMKGRTTIIIAHRLSTIASVDQIVTLKNGQVDEIGRPSQLAKSGGIYGQLLELQSRKPTERTKEKLKEFEIAA